MKQYTVIYNVIVGFNSRATKLIRIETEDISYFTKSIIFPDVCYILEGHPKHEGEDDTSITFQIYTVDENGKMTEKQPEMKYYESTSLCVKYDILKSIFGERFWNDTEDIICVPVKDMRINDFYEIYRSLNIDSEQINKYKYLISE